ncbi:site-specific integrase [Corallococcus exiguus]|uniref:tyrosine-type recombinase/integrase n=1 Tax=Corallococcus exiguus TaxID=83462 RepID=UPI0014739B89|nr:site-specific integrase [Corallococcus exiguus]NNB96678.1 site-specific integrase [Corallococcus exiguus]
MARAYFRPKKGVSGKRREAPRNGTWWIDYRGADGVRRQERTPAVTQTEAERYAQDAAKRSFLVRTGGASEAPTPMTFSEAARRYRETVRHLISYRMVDSYLRLHVEPCIGKKLLQEVTPADLDAMTASLRKKLAPGSINLALIRVSSVYRWAHKARIFRGENPVEEAARVRVPVRAPRALTAPQLQALLKAAGRWRLLFLVAAWCGLRKGELLGLKWDDVDLNERVIHVRRSYDRETTKGRRERIVPMPAWLADELHDARKAMVSGWVFPGRKGKMRQGEHFRTADHFRATLVRANLIRGWRMECPCGHSEDLPAKVARDCPACGAAVLPTPVPVDMTFRHLRSTCATLLGDLRTAQAILGHSSPAVTARHYYAANLETLRAAVEAMPRARDTDGTPPQARHGAGQFFAKNRKQLQGVE